MTLRKTVLATAIALACGTAHAGDVISINPDNGGPDPTISVGSLGWNNGNAISLPVSGPITPTIAPGTIIQTYGQGTLANFNNSGGNTIGGLTLNTAYEWTYVFGFEEIATAGTVGTHAEFANIAGGTNFFQVYYDPSPDSNNLAGTGFNDGTLILQGTILPFGDPSAPAGSGASAFTATAVASSPLDGFGNNDYPNITSVSGVGSSFFAAHVTFSNPAFFLTPPTVIQVTNNTFQNDPYLTQNPSACFWNGAAFIGGAGNGGTCANTIGTQNGLTGPNIMFETRATTDFKAVPEPGSLALLGLGLGLAGLSRWRAARKAS